MRTGAKGPGDPAATGGLVARATKRDEWELRHRTKAGVLSSIPFCGYRAEQLRQLRACGYRLYLNGKAYQTRV